MAADKTKTDDSGGTAIKKRVSAICRALEKNWGEVPCPLTFQKDYELAIAVLLSAQCTDEQVNKVTPVLFKELPDLESLAAAPLEKIEQLIYSTGFYRNKAKSIKGLANRLIDDFDRRLPDNMKDLVSLPGIGRKTANVLLNELHDQAVGITVDTHVARICRLWGFTASSNAVVIEKDLMALLPRRYWRHFALQTIMLGRSYCTARRRDCAGCPLKKVCPAAEPETSDRKKLPAEGKKP